MKKVAVIICALTLFFGCARIRTDFAPLDVGSVARNPSSDVLLTTGDLDRPYREVGVIFVKGRHVQYGKIMETLRSRAKDLGADAVIKIEFPSRYGRLRRPYCRGLAVIFE